MSFRENSRRVYYLQFSTLQNVWSARGQTLGVSSRRRNSLIKFCLASPRLGPPHPHAHNLDTLGNGQVGISVCNVSQVRKPPQLSTNVCYQLDLYRSDLNLQNLSLLSN